MLDKSMKNIHIHKQKVFRETENVLFYDITIKESNASDLVIHDSAAVSPPDDDLGNKQFYVHYHQIDNNRVVHGSRTFELINFDWDRPYQIIKLTRNSGLENTKRNISSFNIVRYWIDSY